MMSTGAGNRLSRADGAAVFAEIFLSWGTPAISYGVRARVQWVVILV
jgi:hypothetical protein